MARLALATVLVLGQCAGADTSSTPSTWQPPTQVQAVVTPAGDPYTTAAWPQVGMAPRNSRERCVSWVENRDRYDRSANPGHAGRWQLSRGLWARFAPHLETWFPGITGRWGWSGPLQQDAVFAVVVANDGYSDYVGDGC